MKTFAALFSALALFAVSTESAKADIPQYCTGCNFAGAKLAGSSFANAIYVGINFTGADLRRATFRGAQLVAANFENADLREAVFDGAECTACNFDGAKLDRASFTGVRIISGNFPRFVASLDDAGLRALLGGCLSCNFRSSQLAERDLSDLALISVDLSGADLRGTKFNGAILCWYDVQGGQRQPKCDSLSGAQVAGANFQNAQLCANPMERNSCTPVDAATLRRNSGSALDGATPP